MTKNEKSPKEWEEENQNLRKEKEALYVANEAMAQENSMLRELFEGLESENEKLKTALRAVARQLRGSADGIDEALARIEGVELN